MRFPFSPTWFKKAAALEADYNVAACNPKYLEASRGESMRITITGIDEKTDLSGLRPLLRRSVEIGILVSETPENRPRYPRLEWITEAIKYLSPQCSVHICGSRARAALNVGMYNHWFTAFGAKRMQVNGKLTVEEAKTICGRFSHVPIITQHTEANSELANADVGPNHCLLVDGSGGRGVAPAEFIAPNTSKPVGFAGGLGPQSMQELLPKIQAVAKRGAWVDMEGKIRDSNDYFSIDKAVEAVEAFYTCLD